MANFWMSVCIGVLVIKHNICNSEENQNGFQSVDILFESRDEYPDDIIFVDVIDNEPLPTTDLVVPYPSFHPSRPSPTADPPFHPPPHISTATPDPCPEPDTPHSTEHPNPYEPITTSTAETFPPPNSTTPPSTETPSNIVSTTEYTPDPNGPTDITPFPVSHLFIIVLY